MDRCKYCNEYHYPNAVCDAYIKAVEEGKVEIKVKKCEHAWMPSTMFIGQFKCYKCGKMGISEI